MNCTREEFYKWLNTCPCTCERINDDFGNTTVWFEYEEVLEPREEDND